MNVSQPLPAQPAATGYAQVVVDVLSSEVDKSFDYAVTQPVQVGSAVEVRFSGRVLPGIVVGLSPQTQIDPKRVLPILRVGPPACTPEQVDLAFYLRQKHHATLAACLRLMLPPAVRNLQAQKQQTWVALAPGVDAAQAQAELPKNATAMRRVLALLAAGEQPRAALAGQVPNAAAVIHKLQLRNWVTLRTQDQDAAPKHPQFEEPQKPVHTPDQAAVIARLSQAMADGGGGFLLQGVTGSGKTEVYLSVAEHALSMGKTVLILVPEIALTPQMVSRFQARFGQSAAVLHSRLTQAQRAAEWRRIRAGQAGVVIGARSAVFAPLQHLGLIVVDEEHEHTYASERTPCYHAVDIALRRAASHGAVALLGSATPSVESRVMAQEGRLQPLSLPQRVNGAPLPPIQVVDMRQELIDGNRTIFSRPLAYALADTLDRHEQAILFINRRGYATAVTCRACGKAIHCDHCDIAMSYHQHGNVLRCHYCDARRPMPQQCPYCQSRQIKTFGVGTQQVEDALLQLFPTARVARMDHDTTRDRQAFAQLYSQVRSHQVDVLIGTQMVTKGLDFPHVTTVGVIAADTTLRLPDFRAQEKTFQLIVQVAGRAGRADLPGQVIVQTYMPEEPAIACAAAYDDTTFYAGEIARRQAGLFPPFGRFLRLVFSSPKQQAAQQAAQAAFTAWRRQLADHPGWQNAVVFDQCMPAPVTRLEGVYRYQVLMRVVEDGQADDIEAALHAASRQLAHGVLCNLEVNPQTLM